LIDDALDRTIAPGYGRLGLAVRRRLPGWPADPSRMDGRSVLVTGAASGLGLAAAEGFARLGATVHGAVRSEKRAADLPAGIRPVVCDLSSVAALRAVELPAVDVLVCNAGVMPPERTHTDEGIELMFATHVVGTWLLIERLRARRTIVVSSGGMYSQQLPFGDPQSERDEYSPPKFYARTKRQQVVLAELWAERLAGEAVVHAMHPGWADTGGLQASLPGFSKLTKPIVRTPEEGADTIVWLGGAPEALESTGRFWHDRRQRPTHYRLGAGEDPPEARAELWNSCAELASR
jgi:NAD(P)-dependent dehydrogenase (short-subunit alcohol dehydrogenase family)